MLFVRYHFFVSILIILFDAQASLEEMKQCWEKIVPCNIDNEQRREAHAKLGKILMIRDAPEYRAEAFFHFRRSLSLGCEEAGSQLARALQAEKVQITNDQKEFDLFWSEGKTEGNQEKRIKIKLSLFFLLEHIQYIKTPDFLEKYFEELKDLSVVSPLYWKYEHATSLGRFRTHLSFGRFRTMSFGSCLSNWVCNALARVSGIEEEKVFTVKRCRSDYFHKSFIEKLFSVDLREFNSQSVGLDVLRDQTDLLGYSGISMGCLGPHQLGRKKKKAWVESFAEEELDLIVIDNYADIKFKVARFKDQPEKIVFCVPSTIANFDSALALDLEYLPVEESIHHFNEVISFFKREKPRAKIVFVHFPFGSDPNKHLSERGELMSQKFSREDILILSPVSSVEDTTDYISHFKPQFYNQLARRILDWFFEREE